jgi:hypothetical protein
LWRFVATETAVSATAAGIEDTHSGLQSGFGEQRAGERLEGARQQARLVNFLAGTRDDFFNGVGHVASLRCFDAGCPDEDMRFATALHKRTVPIMMRNTQNRERLSRDSRSHTRASIH